MSLRNIPHGLSAAILACGLSACSLQKTLTKAEPTGFQKSTGAPVSSRIARLPFNNSWRDPRMDPARYSHVVIRPVTLAYLRKDQWRESASAQLTSQAMYMTYAREVAKHWDQSLRRAFSTPGNRLSLTGSTSQPGTLVLEIAMTEIMFGHPETYVASWAVPGGGVADGVMFSPTVAFEARVRDASTGKIVATAGDRRGTRIKAVDFNRLTMTRPNEEICDEWSIQIMQAFNKELFPEVRRSWFSLY